jgi:ATP-dependent helicase HrpA
MPNTTKLALTDNPYGSVPALLEDCVAAAVDSLVAGAGGPPWDAASFELLRDAVRPSLERSVEDLVRVVGTVLGTAHDIETRARALTHPQLQPAVDDVRAQLAELLGAGFVSRTGRRRLDAVLRYLQAVERRLDRLTDDVDRDRRAMREVHQLQQEYAELVASLPRARQGAADVVEVRWMLEELRVSLFAQPMKTAYPVSEKRVLRAMDAVSG